MEAPVVDQRERFVVNWKPVVRRFLTATSVPPLAQAYTAMYRMLATTAARHFAGYPGTRALYLSRGLASERIVPGVSDIDFTLFGEWDEATRRTMTGRYARLARWLPVFDPNAMQFLFSPAEMREQHHSDPLWWYRFTQARQRWKLLHGEDVLSALPVLDDAQHAAGLMLEVKLWWMHFANRALAPVPSGDPIFLNGICYKAVSEILAAGVFLDTGRLPASRRHAVAAAAKAPDGGIPRRLLACLESRYRRYAGDLVEDTWQCLLAQLEHWFQRAEHHPGNVPVRIPQRLEGGSEPACAPLGGQVDEAIAEARRWPGLRQAHVVSSLAFSIDEVLVLLETDPARLPTAAQIAALNRRLSSPRVHAFLLLPQAAYQLNVFHRGKSWQTILTPGFNPDVYLQIGRPAQWTKPLARFVRLEQKLLHEAFGQPQIYKSNTLVFLQGFWKSLQLAVVEHSARSGAVVYPAALEAIATHLAEAGLTPPAWLDQAITAYRDALAGSPRDLGALLPEAVAYGRAVSACPN